MQAPDWDAPKGHHFEAFPASVDRWRPLAPDGGIGYVCRRYPGSPTRRCPNQPVAKLNRGIRRGRPMWWNYCAEHMYGRWIENGTVMEWTPVLDAQTTYAGG